MNNQVKHYFFLLIFFPLLAFASPTEDHDYWVCKTQDENNMEWIIKNNYQKIALNLSFDACKKESKDPKTCKTSVNSCEGFHLGLSTKPFWRCTALDKKADYWTSNYYPNMDDAAIAAKAYCKSKSKVPDSCYVNLITCANANGRFD